jgi:hypothetical protein
MSFAPTKSYDRSEVIDYFFKHWDSKEGSLFGIFGIEDTAVYTAAYAVADLVRDKGIVNYAGLYGILKRRQNHFDSSLPQLIKAIFAGLNQNNLFFTRSVWESQKGSSFQEIDEVVMGSNVQRLRQLLEAYWGTGFGFGFGKHKYMFSMGNYPERHFGFRKLGANELAPQQPYDVDAEGYTEDEDDEEGGPNRYIPAPRRRLGPGGHPMPVRGDDEGYDDDEDYDEDEEEF